MCEKRNQLIRDGMTACVEVRCYKYSYCRWGYRGWLRTV